MAITTVRELKGILSNLEDDYKIELRVRRRMTDKELIGTIYPYPFKTIYTELEFDDVGVSDRVLCLGCLFEEI